MSCKTTKAPSIRLPNPITVAITGSTHFLCCKAGCRNACAECARVEPDVYPLRLNAVQPVNFPPPNPECPGYLMLPWGIFQHAVDLKLHGWHDDDLLVVRLTTDGYEAHVTPAADYVARPSEYFFQLGMLVDAMPMPDQLPPGLRVKMSDFATSDTPWREGNGPVTEANKAGAAQTEGSTLNGVQPPNGYWKLNWVRDPFNGGVAYYAYDYDDQRGRCYACISGEFGPDEVEDKHTKWAIAITAPHMFEAEAQERLSVVEGESLDACRIMVESWLLPEPGAETPKPEVTEALVGWASRTLARMGFGCLAIVPSMTDDGDLMLERQTCRWPGPVILLSPTLIEDCGQQVPAWDVMRRPAHPEVEDMEHLCTLRDFREAFAEGVRFVNDTLVRYEPLPRGANPDEDADEDRLAADDFEF